MQGKETDVQTPAEWQNVPQQDLLGKVRIDPTPTSPCCERAWGFV